MLFIRRGARNVFIRSRFIPELADYLSSSMEGRVLPFNEAWTEVKELQSLLFITPPGPEKTLVADAEKIVMVPREASRVFAGFFNSGIRDLIENVQLGPGMILIRIVGDGVQLEEELKGKYGAPSMGLAEAISEGEADDTILMMTNKPLSKAVTLEELIRQPLLVREPTHQLYLDLRSQGAHLITQSLEDKQWYEMRINIYDADDHYEVHYERLQAVLSEFDIGMILGETWTRDHALALMSVLAYQVRLFTPEPPERIKRILMGLEYDLRGRRFVDMDLYYRNRKVGKNDKRVRKARTETRPEIRDELYRSLSQDTLKYLQRLEEVLGKKR